MALDTQKKYLLSRFCDFYREIALIKAKLSEGRGAEWTEAEAEESRTPPTEGGEKNLAFRLSDSLRRFMENQALDVRERRTDMEYKAFREAQYLMASLADEIFILEFEWPGKKYWEEFLLEKKLFNTCNSGKAFFDRLDALLGTPTKNALMEELAAVFLMCIRLGFAGQFRGKDGKTRLDEYRHKLLQFMGFAGLKETIRTPLFDQAYAHRVSGDQEQRLAPLLRWYLFGMAVLVVYLLISTFLWKLSIFPLEGLLK